MMRGLRDVLPLIVGIIIVAILLMSWIRSAAKLIYSRPHPAIGGVSTTPRSVRFASAMTPDGRLHQLALAIQMYVADYEMKLPPISSMRQLQSLILPYVKDPYIFIDPSSGTFFGVNTSLSLKPMNRIRDPADIVIFYQMRPDPSTKKRWAAFLDGHVKQVDQKRWQQLSRKSGIPQKPRKKGGRKP